MAVTFKNDEEKALWQKATQFMPLKLTAQDMVHRADELVLAFRSRCEAPPNPAEPSKKYYLFYIPRGRRSETYPEIFNSAEEARARISNDMVRDEYCVKEVT